MEIYLPERLAERHLLKFNMHAGPQRKNKLAWTVSEELTRLRIEKYLNWQDWFRREIDIWVEKHEIMICLLISPCRRWAVTSWQGGFFSFSFVPMTSPIFYENFILTFMVD